MGMSYTTANIALDFLLLAFLSTFMLSRNGWLFAGLMVMVIIPYALPLPEDAMLSANRPATQAALVEESREPTLNPVTSPGDVAALYGQVSGGLGGDSEQATKQINEQIEQMGEQHEGVKAANETRKATGRLVSELTNNVQAAWLFIRIFWCAAALVLLVQRLDLGIIAFCAPTIPVLWLIQGLPYWIDRLEQMQFIAAVDEVLQNPSRLSLWVRDHVGLFIFYLVLAGLGVLIGSRISGWLNARKAGRLERFLDPAAYQLRMSGQLLDFWVEDDNLVVENIRFSLANVRVDRADPSVWILGSGTRIEFVSRDE
jgi:hypothetical protein